MNIDKSMSKEAFLCDMQGIEETFESGCRAGVGIMTVQVICVAIFRLLALYIHLKVGYIDE